MTLRVLHVIPSASPVHGGPTEAIFGISRALASKGIDVHVATTDDNGIDRLDVPLGKPVNHDNATFWYFKRQTRFYTISLGLTRWLSRHIKEYDLVHIHALFSYSSTPAAYWATKHHVPYIVRPLGTLKEWARRERRSVLKKISFSLTEKRILSRATVVTVQACMV